MFGLNIECLLNDIDNHSGMTMVKVMGKTACYVTTYVLFRTNQNWTYACFSKFVLYHFESINLSVHILRTKIHF